MIKEVLIIFKTHLDIGFTDYSRSITRRYIEQYIPNAIKVGYKLKGTNTPFVWTVGSWLIYMALKEDDGTLEKAINDGIICWHGTPFTTHTELMSPKLFEYGLSVSKELDKRFGRVTTAAKLTDVPGHTIGMVPLMAEAGIKFLHIGVNPATPLPNVPELFRWQCGNESIVVMYEDDYGKVREFDDFAVVFAHTGDNKGPQDPDEIVKVYEQIQRKYPQAILKAATIDDLGEYVCRCSNLPVIKDEIGDTWIHGAGTDPKKVSMFRSLMRHIDKNGVGNADLSDNLLLVPEHTWGMDIKTFFPHKEHFYDLDCDDVADAKSKVEASWAEQRDYIRKAEKVLGVKAEYDTSLPDLSEYKEVQTEASAVSLSWQLFDNRDYQRYKEKYIKINDDWAMWDFTKVGLPDYVGGIFEAKVKKVYKNGKNKITLMAFPDSVEKEYGLPFFYVLEDGKNVTVKWYNKKASRLPQSFWLKFNGLDESFEINKMGKWIKPESIVGSPLITAVYEGIKNESVTVKSLDASLVAPFGRHLLDYKLPTDKQDMYFCLYNNIWNTNFPMWYSDDAIFRFVIEKNSDK